MKFPDIETASRALMLARNAIRNAELPNERDVLDALRLDDFCDPGPLVSRETNEMLRRALEQPVPGQDDA